MRDIAGFLGWIVVGGFIFEIFNFVLKFINKKYISKLSSDNKKFVDVYRKVMRFFIKYHKVVGILISLTIIVHFILMFAFVRISITGIISALLMLSIFVLGLYGAFIKKVAKGNWIKIHRSLAFILVIFIIIHII